MLAINFVEPINLADSQNAAPTLVASGSADSLFRENKYVHTAAKGDVAAKKRTQSIR